MDINNQFDKEMLSAYLDDALSASELAQVDQWLAEDSAAAVYLESLRSNRNTLKAIAGLPTAGLKASFTDRVLAQAIAARTEAQAQESTKTRLSDPEPVRIKPWWAWATLAATAAAIGWFALLPLWQPPQKPLALLPDQKTELPVEPSLGDVASQDPLGNRQPEHVPLENSIPGGKSVDNSRNTPEDRHQRSDMPVLDLMFIGEVLMSEAAWDAGKFDELIATYGIRYDKELVASQALIEGLIESKVIAGTDSDPDKRQDVAIVYIDCPAVAMSKLLVSLENDGKDFIGFSYSLAMSGAGIGLGGNYDKLINALQQQTSPSSGRGIARLIVPDKNSQELSKLLPRFEAVEMSTDKSFANLVAGDAQLKGSIQGVNESGKLLLIIRKN